MHGTDSGIGQKYLLVFESAQMMGGYYTLTSCADAGSGKYDVKFTVLGANWSTERVKAVDNNSAAGSKSFADMNVLFLRCKNRGRLDIPRPQ